MHPRTHLSFCKFLRRIPFSSHPKPQTLIPSKPITTKSFHPFPPPPTSQSYSNKPLLCQFKIFRSYNSETDKVVDEINLKFAEAREEIEMAMESRETVYFNEEAECARGVVKQVLEMYDGLLDKLPEKERGGIQRSMGLKIEQLKAELEQLNE
ncbi:hypothetical protein SSX86_007415 [Deinandra increscens subsp. villosa]|uniref:Uncharacterized protein n=1 Tax=Deinandra increscens subsp. villosa TaxID=3103831 RepID=A0AAP0H327_9ASTR